ncbi:MAG TPA: aminotransferase class I/II-fold pyridoxal phosphate-dependent enzyme, partial [Gemmatimonadaceae bacterium]|nr:aminotransferase class I/II-fold pyridoxal phosphate-dependent enzyme [Gemmatimonadaceae bacterium]
DLDHDTMRRLGHLVADTVAHHLSTLRQQPAYATLDTASAERLVDASAPSRGTDFETLLATLRDDVFPHAAREPHPGFIAYVPSCPTFPAILGDWLATGFNFFAGVWPVAAGPNEIELIVLEWFRQWLDMPVGTGGLLTSGGSGANLTAMIAARHRVTGGDASVIAKLTVYASDQTHSSVTRAAWLAGIPRQHVRLLPSDDAFRADVAELRDALARDRAAGLVPLMIVANAGTTNTGSVDPMHEIAELCERENVWLHVDAAYGGFAVLTDIGRRALAGIKRADSVTLDPHKWLFVPFECGCLLVRDPARLKAAFQIFPEYLADAQTGHEAVNFADYGEQLTRYSRALKVWMSVRYFGTDAIRDAIDRGMMLARRLEDRVRTTPTLEIVSPARFGVVCFRVRPDGADDAALDTLNQRVLARVVGEGRYFISSTRLRGAFALRACILGFRTAEDDIDGLVHAVAEAARQLSAVQPSRPAPAST